MRLRSDQQQLVRAAKSTAKIFGFRIFYPKNEPESLSAYKWLLKNNFPPNNSQYLMYPTNWKTFMFTCIQQDTSYIKHISLLIYFEFTHKKSLNNIFLQLVVKVNIIFLTFLLTLPVLENQQNIIYKTKDA